MSKGELRHGPPVRTGFATATDGKRLYWRAVGTGPAITCCNGVGVSVFFWKYLVEHFVESHTVIVWDYRAHGRSEWPDSIADADMSIGRHAQDLVAVLDAAGVEQTVLVGHSMGCQVIFEAYRRYPERVSGLVPMLGTAGRTLETFFDYSGSPRIFRVVAGFLDKAGFAPHFVVRPLLESPLAWGVARNFGLVDPFYCKREDLLPYLRHLSGLDLRVFLRTALMMNEHDAWDSLPNVRVPTLVVAAEKDAFTPVWLSKKMVTLIPGAEFLMLADGTHAALIEQPETILHRMDRFLAERQVS